MSDVDRVRGWIARLRYKPGWTFAAEEERDGAVVLSATVDVPDVRRAGRTTTVTARIALGPRSASELPAFQARVHQIVTHLELHEVGEWLTFDGERPFDPHV